MHPLGSVFHMENMKLQSSQSYFEAISHILLLIFLYGVAVCEKMWLQADTPVDSSCLNKLFEKYWKLANVDSFKNIQAIEGVLDSIFLAVSTCVAQVSLQILGAVKSSLWYSQR